MLPAQIVEELISRDGKVADSAFEEVPGKRRLRRNHQLRRLRPASDFPEKGADPAEVLLVRTLVGP
jgi:hypothetical protein